MKPLNLRLVALATGLSAFLTPSGKTDETWVAVSLHPAGSTSSIARAVSPAGQFGTGVFGGESKASMWTDSSASFVSLAPPGSTVSEVFAASGTLQGGFGVFSSVARAGIWGGTAASFGDLNPVAAGSRVNGISATQQAGAVFVGSFPLFFPNAAIWNGSPLNFVSLHPAAANGSEILDTDGTHQVGYVNTTFQQAVRWTGSIGSIVNLHPVGATTSSAYSVDSTKQVGEALIGANAHAALWFGTPASFVDLNPTGATSSALRSTDGSRQAGFANFGSGNRAGVWSGTVASFVNLHNFVPGNYTASEAHGILKIGTSTSVVGKAFNNTTSQDEAFLWTLAGPSLKVTGKRRITTSKSKLLLKGTSTNAISVAIKPGKAPALKAVGTNTWTKMVRLKPGVTRIVIESVNSFGDRSRKSLVTVTKE